MIGTILGSRYELIEKIGEGGMAVVYKARCRLLNRYVAVKILKEQYTSNFEFMDKFRKEAAATASFSHTNIVNIYDVGVEGKYNYIVMELVNGKTLKQIICEKGSLEPSEVIDMGIQIAKALECAHKNGIIHRDIKPHNILVTEDGIAKVTDFGIAKASNSDTITHTSRVIGSAHYFSPEQAKGKVVDFRTDIYSLGIVLYEMATGKVPFDGDSPVSIALKHIQEPVVPPIAIRYDIPLSLSNLILKAIEKEPIRRYQSATEIYHDLEQIKNNNNYTIHQKDRETEEFTRIMSPINPEPKKASKVNYTSKNEEYEDDYEEDDDYEDDDDFEEVKPKKKSSKDAKKKRNIVIASIMVLVVLLGAFGITMSIKSFSGSANEKSRKEVKIPQIVGKDKDTVKKMLDELGLVLVVDNEEKSDKEKGTILRVMPSEGTTVKKNSEVKVTISLGEEELSVPDIRNLDSAEAQKQIAALGLKVGKIEKENNETYGEGTVIRQDPQPGSTIKKGGTVNIVISQGSAIVYEKVPSLTNMTIDEAANVLSVSNLQLGETTAVITTDKSLDGKIFNQSAAVGSKVKQQTPINVNYYKYQEPEPEKVSVPRFVGKTLGEAKSLASSLGLNINATGEDKDIVESQSTSEGEKVVKGETIWVTVKKAPTEEEKPVKPENGTNQQ